MDIKKNSLLLFLFFIVSNSLLAFQQPKFSHENLSEAESFDTVFETSHFVFHFVDTAGLNIEYIVDKMETKLEKVVAFSQIPFSVKKITPFFYPAIESKGLKYKNTQPAEVFYGKNYLGLVKNDIFAGEDDPIVNQLIIRNLLGKPHLKVLEIGLSMYFTEHWQREGYAFWAGKLYKSESLPSITDLLTNDLMDKTSPLVMNCTAGVFVEFLIIKYGKTVFFEKYKIWTNETLQALAKEWKAFLLAKYTTFNPTKALFVVPQLKGFNFAHEGFQIMDGYGSALAKISLAAMKGIGSNAVTIVPYTFMGNPAKATLLSFPRHAGAETDEAVIVTAYESKQLGLFTLLKPQIHVEDSWPGGINMLSEEDWDSFFAYYYQWILHYALLAEMNKIDMLCIGVELSIATRNHPDEWRKMIKKIRGIYTGPITYAANWYKEYANIDFWDALDYIGLDCYYPLGHYPKVRKKDLKRTFRKTLKKINKTRKRYNKPLIITEIGYRSVEFTWLQPFDAPKGRAYDAAAQKMCYEVIFEGLETVDWCQGIFWWKWPSYLGYKGKENLSFSPVGKSAEEVIRQYFNKEKLNIHGSRK